MGTATVPIGPRKPSNKPRISNGDSQCAVYLTIDESFIVFIAILLSHLYWPPKARRCGSEVKEMNELSEQLTGKTDFVSKGKLLKSLTPKLKDKVILTLINSKNV